MEIHKPHAAKSWKEFFIELGTIVLGICIAISLEQLVESWHWDHEVKQARAALRAEIRANEASFFVRRLAYEPCLDRQMREADAILTDLEAHRPAGRFTTFHNSNGGPTSDGEWQSQRAAQTLTHFPQDELAMMSRYYAWVSDFKGWVTKEADIWSELGVLRNPPAGLGPSDFLRLRANLNIARRLGTLIKLNTIRVLNLSKALGVPQVPLEQDRQRKFCTTNEEDWQKYLRDIETAQR